MQTHACVLMNELYRAIPDELVDRNGQTLFELCGRLIMKHGIESSRKAISQHIGVLKTAMVEDDIPPDFGPPITAVIDDTSGNQIRLAQMKGQ